MTRVGVRELKNRLSAYLLRVKQGETVSVTERGKEIARLSPVARPEVPEEVLEMVRAGLAAWKGGKPNGSNTPIRFRGKALSSLVIEDRR